MSQSYITFLTSLASKQAFASSLVVTGFATTNAAHNIMHPSWQMAIQSIGRVLYLAGWILTPYLLNAGKPVFIASLLIFLSSSLIDLNKQEQHSEEKTPIFLSLLFIVSWLIFGYFVGLKCYRQTDSSLSILFGVIGSLLAVTSVIYILPWQRKLNLVDGIGMPMYIAAWVIITMLSSCALIISE